MLPLQEEIRRAWKPMGCCAASGTCQSLLDLTSWRTKLPLDEANSKLSPRGVSLSGFVCIMHGDGAPIERGLLQSLTDLLSFRGPEACGIWSDGPLGMGHTLLRTTHKSKNERQPADLEGRYFFFSVARPHACKLFLYATLFR